MGIGQTRLTPLSTSGLTLENPVSENILGIVVVVAILGGAFVFTQWFTRRMYNKCPKCGVLNALRRDRCRECGEPVGQSS